MDDVIEDQKVTEQVCRTAVSNFKGLNFKFHKKASLKDKSVTTLPSQEALCPPEALTVLNTVISCQPIRSLLKPTSNCVNQ